MQIAPIELSDDMQAVIDDVNDRLDEIGNRLGSGRYTYATVQAAQHGGGGAARLDLDTLMRDYLCFKTEDAEITGAWEFPDLDLTGTLTVDTINEHTADSGIAAEGVELKDSALYASAGLWVEDTLDCGIIADDADHLDLKAPTSVDINIGGTEQAAVTDGAVTVGSETHFVELTSFELADLRGNPLINVSLLEVAGIGPVFPSCPIDVLADMEFAAGQVLDLHTNAGYLKARVVEAATEPTLEDDESAWWWDTANSKMYWGVERSGTQYWVEAT